jgi:hypothetical protein
MQVGVKKTAKFLNFFHNLAVVLFVITLNQFGAFCRIKKIGLKVRHTLVWQEIDYVAKQTETYKRWKFKNYTLWP